VVSKQCVAMDFLKSTCAANNQPVQQTKSAVLEISSYAGQGTSKIIFKYTIAAVSSSKKVLLLTINKLGKLQTIYGGDL